MPRPLVDLLWRDSPHAPLSPSRGPRPRHSTDDVVTNALALADAGGLGAVTIRGVAQTLGMTAMSVYTHVNSRDDLLVLMADEAHALMPRTRFGRSAWRTRVRRIADDNRDLLQAHPWLLDINDPRTALGPGTIAKYDHELRAFDGTAIMDLDRDAAVTFLLDFVQASAARSRGASTTEEFGGLWERSAGPLARYLGDSAPVAQRVGRVAGEAMGAPYDAELAWQFGLARVMAGLADLVERDRRAT